MPYHYVIGCRDRYTYLAFGGTIAIVIYLATKSLAFLVFPGLVVAWAGICLALDRKWSGCVKDGRIFWTTFFRGRQRNIRISNIECIEIHHDPDGPLYLVFKYRNGKRRRAPLGIYKFGDHEAFISAVLEEVPTIQVSTPRRWFDRRKTNELR